MTNKIAAIAVDDDLVALKIISSLIEQVEYVDLLGMYQDPFEAVNAIFESKPDVIFLDVEMPGMTGLELIESLKNPPEIILITSKKDYAIEAFNLKVTDYLLKPIDSFARFMKAINRAQENIEKKLFDKESGVTYDETKHDSIFVKVDSLLLNVSFDEIYYLEAYGDYVKIHTADKMFLVLTRLKSVEDKLPTKDFVRIHRSYIVRIDKIENIDHTNLQINGKILPISLSQKKQLMDKINIL